MLGQGTGYLSSGQWGDDATMASSSFFPVPRLSQSKQASKQASYHVPGTYPGLARLRTYIH